MPETPGFPRTTNQLRSSNLEKRHPGQDQVPSSCRNPGREDGTAERGRRWGGVPSQNVGPGTRLQRTWLPGGVLKDEGGWTWPERATKWEAPGSVQPPVRAVLSFILETSGRGGSGSGRLGSRLALLGYSLSPSPSLSPHVKEVLWLSHPVALSK